MSAIRVALLIAIAGTMLLPLASEAAKPQGSQPALGTLIPGKATAATTAGGDYDAVSKDEALRTGRKVAECIATHRRKEIIAFLLSDGKGRLPQNVQREMGFCLGNRNSESFSSMRLDGPTLHGLLAEAVIAASPPQLSSVEMTNEGKAQLWAAGPSALDQTAACVAQTHPDRAISLLTAEPASSREVAAFDGLMPALKACIDSHGAFRADRMSVRFAMALALLHRVYGPPPGMALTSKDTH